MKIVAPEILTSAVVEVPTSKSIANRLLIIQALAGAGEIIGLSEAKDTQILKNALDGLARNLNVGHAGTTFRFLTAFLAIQKGEFVLTGSERMLERPIGILVEALRELGAKIKYEAKAGYPPLKIIGGDLHGGEISVNAHISSQFITSLMLIGPYLKSGLVINLIGEMVSLPYVTMTYNLMQYFGIEVRMVSNQIIVGEGKYSSETIQVEKDWSSIAFWYEWVAIGKISKLLISDVREESIQGDISVMAIFEKLGVMSHFDPMGLHLSYSKALVSRKKVIFDLMQSPDLAQPVIVTLVALIIPAKITGLSTLKNKETNRGEALKLELAKFGVVLRVEEDYIEYLGDSELKVPQKNIDTYNDHRMAMAFAPLVLRVNKLEIDNPEVVDKSYPEYWKEVRKLGMMIID